MCVHNAVHLIASGAGLCSVLQQVRNLQSCHLTTACPTGVISMTLLQELRRCPDHGRRQQRKHPPGWQQPILPQGAAASDPGRQAGIGYMLPNGGQYVVHAAKQPTA
jgi:hypothetical protein